MQNIIEIILCIVLDGTLNLIIDRIKMLTTAGYSRIIAFILELKA